MADSQSGNVSPIAHGDRYLTAAASLLVGGAFFGLWFWLLPQWLGFRADLAGAAHWRWLAALPSVLGFAVALRCVWDFGWTGRGTPAPFAPPQRLVVVGLYRYVRNPMYLGCAVGWVGSGCGLCSATLIRRRSRRLPSSRSACTCLSLSTKSRLCRTNSGQTTKSIAGMWIDGCRASRGGTSHNSCRVHCKFSALRRTAFTC